MVKRTNLTVEDRQFLKDFLLERVEGGQLRRNSIRDGAVLVSVSMSTVSRLWQRMKDTHAIALNGQWDVTSGKTNNGRPVKYPRDEFVRAVRDVPLRNTGALFGFCKAQLAYPKQRFIA